MQLAWQAGSAQGLYGCPTTHLQTTRPDLKQLHFTTALVLVLTSFSGCIQNEAPPLRVAWGVIDNHLDNRFRCRIILRNTGDNTLPESGWTIYFNFLRMVIPESVPAEITIDHVNGDLVRLDPADTFRPLQPGDERVFEFEARHWAINVSDAPAGPYIVFHATDERPERIVALGDVFVEPFVGRRQTDRGRQDALPVVSPGVMFDDNERHTRPADAPPVTPITPAPVLLERGSDSLRIGPSLVVRYPEALSVEAHVIADDFDSLFAITPTLEQYTQGADSERGANIITLRQGKVDRPAGLAASSESYRLTVDAALGIEVVGTGPAGVFYGTRSLLALVPPHYYHQRSGEASLPTGRVTDAPRFAYRGMHLDVARNFQSRDAVLKLLNLMSYYKLNRFHFHLTDDEGWRLEIAGLPELTTVGSRRGHVEGQGGDVLIPSFGSGPDPDPQTSHGSGYYTRDDFVEILRFAARRHIEVVPEIDVPGHARAAIRSMDVRRRRLSEQGNTSAAERFLLTHEGDTSKYMSVQHWNDNVVDVCLPSTYAFLTYVIDDIIDMYAEANVPVTAIHTGGDEVPNGVWVGSPACQKILESRELDSDPKHYLSNYFLDRVNQILNSRNLVTAGWEEIALGNTARNEEGDGLNRTYLDRGLRPYVWNNVWGGGAEDLAYRLANAGFEVVMSSASNLYFDLAYGKHPLEPGYYWAGFVGTREAFEFAPLNIFATANRDVMGHATPPSTYADRERLTPAGRARIIGIQGQLWGENAKGQEMMEYLTFPKLLGLAERSWSPEPVWESEHLAANERRRSLESGWAEFAERLGTVELPRLDALYGGVRYRIPPPGLKKVNNTVSANSAFPGLVVRFTRDGRQVDATSEEYTGPVSDTGALVFRSFDTRGRGSRSVVPE